MRNASWIQYEFPSSELNQLSIALQPNMYLNSIIMNIELNLDLSILQNI